MSDAEELPNAMSTTGWRTNAIASNSVQTIRRDGREYLRFPLIPLTEMVLDYPETGTREYLPAHRIEETANAWDGVPLTYVHPDNRQQTVYDADSFMGDVIGAFHNPKSLNGGQRLRGFGLIDVQKAEDLGGMAARLVELLRNNEEVSVSAGYATVEDEFRSGTFDGDPYDLVQGMVIPDHIAVFPSDAEVMARCSPEDGCAAPRVNAYEQQYSWNGWSANPANPLIRANYEETQNMSETATESSGSGIELTNDEGEPLASRAEFEELKAMVKDLFSMNEGAEQRTNTAAGHCDCDRACQCNRTNAVVGDGRRNRGRSGLPYGGRVTRRANMIAVPGRFDRRFDDMQETEDPDEYPAGGRRAYERRKVGLDEISNEKPSGLASGRTNYERAKRERQRVNSTEGIGSNDGQSYPTGTRSSHETRANAMEEGESDPWLDSEYPLTSKQKHEQQEKQQREYQERLEAARRGNRVESRESQ